MTQTPFLLPEDGPVEDDETGLPSRHHHVTAIVVTHNGARWLPIVLATLAGQTRLPDLSIGVDTGSTDSSPDLLSAALGAEQTVRLGPTIGFGTAIRRGLDLADRLDPPVSKPSSRPPAPKQPATPTPAAPTPPDEPIRWVWLLHDDAAAASDALTALLATADRHLDVAVLGPKVRSWQDRRVLIEAGVTIAGSGRRETGLERREYDQGQQDGDRDVLAVGSAGMLVRRDVWDRLRGFDPALPLFRDDLEFGWRAWLSGERVMVATDAVFHHVQAAAHGRRAIAAGPADPRRQDRAATLHVLLVYSPAWRQPFTVLRLVLGTLLTAAGLLLAKAPSQARAHLGALFDVLTRPRRVMAARRRVAATAVRPRLSTRQLRPGLSHSVRHTFDGFGLAWAAVRPHRSGRPDPRQVTGSAGSAPLDTGPVGDDAAYLEDPGGGAMRRVLTRPGVLFGLVLLVLAVLTTRGLWWGEGRLSGGALLPAPDGAGDLWLTYADAWHVVGTGTSTAAPAYLAVLATVATVLLGKAPLAVQLLLLLAVPLAAVSAYVGLRGLVGSRTVRMWAAVTYALLPAVPAATATGRVGTAVVAVLLPTLSRLLLATVRQGAAPRETVQPPSAEREPAGDRPAGGGWWLPALAALLLALVTAFVPAVWLVAAVAMLAGTAALVAFPAARPAWSPRGTARAAGRTLFVLAASLLLLTPWSFLLLEQPGRWLLEPGLAGPGLTDSRLNAVHVLLVHPGGPGMTPVWFTAGVLVAGVLAVLRRGRARAIVTAWGIALLGLLLGVAQLLAQVDDPAGGPPLQPWPGTATLILGGGLIWAAALAADGVQARLAGATFSWRQPALAVVTVTAVVAPLLAAGHWLLSGVSGPIEHAPASALPAFVVADAGGPARPRTLVLRSGPGPGLRYALTEGAGSRLGDADLAAPLPAGFQPLVAALASGRGGGEAAGLATYAVRYVLLVGRTDGALVRTLDSQPGLRRISTSAGDALWRVDGITSRARLRGPAAGASAAVPIDGSARAYSVALPGGPAGRNLVVADSADPGWSAEGLAGALPVETSAAPGSGWSQAFQAPDGGGRVEVSYDQTSRTRWLWAQLVLLVVLLVLALPGRTRTEEIDEDDAAAPVAAAAPDFREITHD